MGFGQGAGRQVADEGEDLDLGRGEIVALEGLDVEGADGLGFDI